MREFSVVIRPALDLPGVVFVPTYFKPQFQKHSEQVCAGVEIVVADRKP